MDVKQFVQTLFAQGRAAGFTEMEVYHSVNRDLTVRVFKGDIDAYNVEEKGGLSFRGLYNGTMGYSFAEKLDAASIELLIHEARENAEIIDANEQVELFSGSERYQSFRASEKIASLSPEVIIDAALELERTALEADPRIHLVNYCILQRSESEVLLLNTKGLDCRMERASASCGISVLAKDGDDVASAMEYGFAFDEFDDLSVREVALSAAQQALSKLNAQTVQSDEYPVILRGDVMASLLQQFTPLFSGEQAAKGLSLLQGKVGEQVAAAQVTLIDDPHLSEGPGSTPFDAEGVATKRLELIKEGQLLTLLHNRKSAAKAGVETTGHAVKGTYRSPVSIAPTNLYLQPGTQSLDDLIESIDQGVLIVELQGLHAGANAVSGDFSLSALGHWIEGGQIVHAVNQITVSGNILQLLGGVEALGHDQRWRGGGRGAVAAPSVKVRALSVAGK